MSVNPLEVIADKRMLTLYQYWDSKRAGRPMPTRADIDPTEIPTLLPFILLIDVLDGGADFRYRLVGTDIVRWVGNDLTGRTFAEVLPAGNYADYIAGIARESIRQRSALYSEGGFVVDGRVDRQVRRLVLPLSADGTTVNMFLCGQIAIAAIKNAQIQQVPDGAPFNETLRVVLP